MMVIASLRVAKKNEIDLIDGVGQWARIIEIENGAAK